MTPNRVYKKLCVWGSARVRCVTGNARWKERLCSSLSFVLTSVFLHVSLFLVVFFLLWISYFRWFLRPFPLFSLTVLRLSLSFCFEILFWLSLFLLCLCFIPLLSHSLFLPLSYTIPFPSLFLISLIPFSIFFPFLSKFVLIHFSENLKFQSKNQTVSISSYDFTDSL